MRPPEASVEGADLCCPVHRENPAAGDDRRRQNPRIARGTLADIGHPGASQPVRQRRVADRVRRNAAGNGPGRVDLGRRQRDRDRRQARVRIEPAADAEHRNPLAGQRRLLLVEHAASGRGGGQQQRGEIAAVHARLTRGLQSRGGAPVRGFPARISARRPSRRRGRAERAAPPDRRPASDRFRARRRGRPP